MADNNVINPDNSNSNPPAPENTGKVPKEKESNKPKEEEMVQVPKSLLESIQQTLKDNQKEITDLRKGQNELEKTASPDQIKKIEALRAQGKLVKSVKISSIDGKMVQSWKSTADEVYVDHALGKEVSRQMTVLTFFDGKTAEFAQIDFARRKSLKEYEVVGERKNKDGEIILTITMEDGREIDINSRFIN